MSEQAKTTAPTKGVPVQLDRMRYLRYPLSFLKSIKEDSGDRSIAQILLMGLRGDDPELTVEKVEDLIDLENLKVLFDPMKKATGGLIDLSKLFKIAELAVDHPQTPAAAESGTAK